MKKKALILTWDSFQDHEVVYPYYRVQEDGIEVDIMSDKVGRIHGILGVYMESTLSVFDLNEDSKYKNHMENYDLLILPGGVKSLEKLRQEVNALKFINEWNDKGKLIGCICHGAQLLISAKITKNRDISGYYSIKDDITNSGANYIDAPTVISDNLVTCPHYKWMGQWMGKVLEIYFKKNG